MTTPTEPRAPRVGRRTKLAAVLVAVTGFLAAVGSAPAVAAWTAAGTATSTANTPTVALTQSGFNTLGTTFLHSTTDQRGGFTITNTGGVAGTPTLTVTAAGTLAANTYTFVWQAASVAACQNTMPGTYVQGTWAAFPAINLGTLAPGASTTVCVRSWASDPDALATSSGTQTVTAGAVATLNVNTWKVSTAAASATLTTKFLYPLATGYAVSGINNWYVIKPVSDATQCFDSFNRGTNIGNTLGVWTCGTQANQRFEILPTQNGKSALRPKTAAETYMGQTNNLTVQAAPGTSATDWRVERITATTYQLVHGDTGLCLQAGANAQNQLIACNGATTQQFTLTREPLTCSINASYLYLNFGAPASNRQYTIQNRLGTDAWTNVYTQTDLNASNYGMPRSMFGGNGTLDLRVVDSVGNVLYAGMTITTTASTIACGNGFS